MNDNDLRFIADACINFDSNLLSKISEYEYERDMLVIDYAVFNAGHVITNATFPLDYCSDYHDCEQRVFCLIELNRSYDRLKKLVADELEKIYS